MQNCQKQLWNRKMLEISPKKNVFVYIFHLKRFSFIVNHKTEKM